MMQSNEAVDHEEFAEFSEGVILFDDTSRWHCEEHSQWVKVGKDCLFCLHDLMGDQMFANYGS